MGYEKTKWQDRSAQYPRRYRMVRDENDPDLVTMIPEPGTVLIEGTDVNAKTMNHMEDGIAFGVDTANGANSAAQAAQTTANKGVTDAANAMAAAKEAQTTANKGVTNAANAQVAADSARQVANQGVTNAATALSAAQEAQTTANKGVTNAATAKTQADKGVNDAAAALAEAKKKIPTVSGATEGHVPVFDSSGNLKSSGKRFDNFTRATFSLSGTTLTITTID